MTRIAQQYDISLVFSDIGLPFLGMIVLILATWTTNTTNAYSAGLNAVMVFNLKESGRSLATVVLGAVGTVLAPQWLRPPLPKQGILPTKSCFRY